MKKLTLITLFALMTVGMTSCFFDHTPFCMTGGGAIVTKEFDLESFNSISAETVYDIEIVQGNEQKVIAEGHENMMSQLDLRVINNHLGCDLINDCYSSFKMKLYITVPEIKNVEVTSTGDITIKEFKGLKSLDLTSTSTGNIIAEGNFKIEDNLVIKSTSTGDIEIDVETDEINTYMSSTGNVSISGTCNVQTIDLTSTGDYNGYNLYSKDCSVVSSGTGNTYVYVENNLDVVISSVGDVLYKGSPRVHVSDSSVGSLISVD